MNVRKKLKNIFADKATLVLRAMLKRPDRKKGKQEKSQQENPTNNSFLKNPESADINIYNQYVERIKKHYELRLQHLKIYFGFNSGLLLVVAFLAKPYLEKLKFDVPLAVPSFFLLIFQLISITGAIFSIAWLFVTKNDREVQLLMNEILGDMEEKIFKNKKLGLYIKINEYYPPQKKGGSDIIDINCYMAFFFAVIWEVLTVCPLYL